MNQRLALFCLCLTTSVSAASLPSLPSEQIDSAHSLFISSEPNSQAFDSWVIDSGYAYNIFRNVDLYVGARINSSINGGKNGFLSGVSYKVNERVLFKSTFYSSTTVDEENRRNESISAELSSRLRLSDNMDLHATLDYQEWQQGIEVGIGFRF
ncbi:MULTISPECIES: hypothetical protein [Vibrio]|uniref:hypothetical protein n=1 Tax=Vibrio TaxID=662 RepID=UPI000C16A3E9|nr:MULTISPECIES: hypothetical protein [Vibrio]NAW69377.1 hypothetical protein [Vibrio sp. V28_P6S34P95]NAX05283.1 hypothetical protein [Vibrio sp. V30_P3S12P165]NAX35293.1 hypothetical protein [Vibrio sp. V29_P1S30P107]NAX37098.1 hypothetical protein [Vibrio sp. V27_P1S3P104]NNN44433.1 hypothetical protein [Vibrio sp. 1-1(7)]